ncbi:MAG TPA: S8 family serine peptidase, partial [Limnochordales bacterium]
MAGLAMLVVGVQLILAMAPSSSKAIAGQVMARPQRPATGTVFDVGIAGKAGQAEAAPGEVVIRFRPSRVQVGGMLTAQARVEARSTALAEVQQAVAALGARVVGDAFFAPTARQSEGLFLYKVQLPDGMSVDEGIRQLSALRGVVYASPNYKRYPAVTYVERVQVEPRDPAPPGGLPPNDSFFGRQWALHNIGQTFRPGYTGADDADIDALEAWAVQVGDSADPVVVAVIDTGTEPTHPDLAANMWINPGEIDGDGIDNDGNGYVDDIYGWDFFNDDNTVYDPEDAEYHGTHVAGTIGAVARNGLGVAGVAWNVRIMALKFLGPNGGYDFDAIRALAYAKEMRDRYGLRMLTSNSWGGGGFSQALKDAIEASDMLFVAAAGNDAVDTEVVPHYPSSYDSPNIISVAASDWEDQLADFSNWGAESVDLAAPGAMILSTYPTDDPLGLGCFPGICFVYASGTSMATPHVSGVAALTMSQYPGEDWASIKQRILSGVDQRPAFQGRVVTGGRLNARNTVTGMQPPVIQSVSVTPTYATPGTTITFSATAHDPDGSIVSMAWEFGDGSSATGDSASHQYGGIGGYFATFRAVDDDGNEAVAGVWIAVANADTVLLVDDDGNTSASDSTEFSFEPALAARGIEYVRVESALDLPPALPNPVIWNTGF